MSLFYSCYWSSVAEWRKEQDHSRYCLNWKPHWYAMPALWCHSCWGYAVWLSLCTWSPYLASRDPWEVITLYFTISISVHLEHHVSYKLLTNQLCFFNVDLSFKVLSMYTAFFFFFFFESTFISHSLMWLYHIMSGISKV